MRKPSRPSGIARPFILRGIRDFVSLKRFLRIERGAHLFDGKSREFKRLPRIAARPPCDSMSRKRLYNVRRLSGGTGVPRAFQAPRYRTEYSCEYLRGCRATRERFGRGRPATAVSALTFATLSVAERATLRSLENWGEVEENAQ